MNENKKRAKRIRRFYAEMNLAISSQSWRRQLFANRVIGTLHAAAAEAISCLLLDIDKFNGMANGTHGCRIVVLWRRSLTTNPQGSHLKLFTIIIRISYGSSEASRCRSPYELSPPSAICQRIIGRCTPLRLSFGESQPWPGAATICRPSPLPSIRRHRRVAARGRRGVQCVHV